MQKKKAGGLSERVRKSVAITQKLRAYMYGWGVWREKREVFRSFYHMSFGFTGWFLIQVLGWNRWLMFFLYVIISTGCMLAEILLIKEGKKSDKDQHLIFIWVKKNLMRDSEVGKQTSMRWVIAGFGIFCVWWLVFDLAWVVVAGALLSGFVDPVAKLVGKNFPLYRFSSGLAQGKSVGGFLGGSLVGFIVVVLLMLPYHLLVESFFPVEMNAIFIFFALLAGAITAGLAELLSGKKDNFWVPTASSTCLAFLYFIWRILEV